MVAIYSAHIKSSLTSSVDLNISYNSYEVQQLPL